MSRPRKPKVKYQVLIAGEWLGVTVAQVQSSGWLHWEDADGTVGLSPPHKWREKPKKEPRE